MTSKKEHVHFVAPYFLNPVHRISIALVGVGGSGCQMLSALARIDHALWAMGHQGLYVTAYDPDEVTEPNIGRQLFSESELGMNKAQAFITRINRFYGLDWKAVPKKFTGPRLPNVIITCVDNVATRIEIGEMFKKQRSSNVAPEHRPYYWLDLGNGQRTGQAVLGSAKIKQPKSDKFIPCDTLPLVTEEFDLTKVDEKDSGPSCSMAEALEKQDLFVNSALVQMAGSLLWSLFRDVVISNRGFYLNLDSFKANGIPVRRFLAKNV